MNLIEDGFTIIDQVFSFAEITEIARLIDEADKEGALFRKTKDLFAIRQLLKEIPQLSNVVFNAALKRIIQQIFGDGFFVVKSIYFDKPGDSNWFVAYHQDLTVSVNHKAEIDGFGPWTTKQGQYAVQPPLEILKNNFTIRIHLDDTNNDNGALRVMPGSHKYIRRPGTIDWTVEREATCNVKAGGIMIMKPLLLHASNRTTNNRKRRVLHIEFSSMQLPENLKWSELYRY